MPNDLAGQPSGMNPTQRPCVEGTEANAIEAEGMDQMEVLPPELSIIR